jgi:predicted  nucleic acid-binding Zn-ribbon protein
MSTTHAINTLHHAARRAEQQAVSMREEIITLEKRLLDMRAEVQDLDAQILSFNAAVQALRGAE